MLIKIAAFTWTLVALSEASPEIRLDFSSNTVLSRTTAPSRASRYETLDAVDVWQYTSDYLTSVTAYSGVGYFRDPDDLTHFSDDLGILMVVY